MASTKAGTAEQDSAPSDACSSNHLAWTADPQLLATPSPCVQAAEKQRKKERAHEKKAESAADREAAAAASRAAAQAEVSAAATQASEQAARCCPPALRRMLGRPLPCTQVREFTQVTHPHLRIFSNVLPSGAAQGSTMYVALEVSAMPACLLQA